MKYIIFFQLRNSRQTKRTFFLRILRDIQREDILLSRVARYASTTEEAPKFFLKNGSFFHKIYGKRNVNNTKKKYRKLRNSTFHRPFIINQTFL